MNHIVYPNGACCLRPLNDLQRERVHPERVRILTQRKAEADGNRILDKLRSDEMGTINVVITVSS